MIYPDPPKPDRFELAIRAVCGTLFGVLVGFCIWTRVGWFTPIGALTLFGASIVACAIGAARHGDAFWERALRRR